MTRRATMRRATFGLLWLLPLAGSLLAGMGCDSGRGAPSFVKYTSDSKCLAFDDTLTTHVRLYYLSSGQLYQGEGFFVREDERGHRWVLHAPPEKFILVWVTAKGEFEQQELPNAPLHPHFIDFGPKPDELTMLESYYLQSPRACRLDLKTGRYTMIDSKLEVDRLLQAENESHKHAAIDLHEGLTPAHAIEFGPCSSNSREINVQRRLTAPDGKTEVLAKVQAHPGIIMYRVYGDCRLELKDLKTGQIKTLIANENEISDPILDVTLAPFFVGATAIAWVLEGCHSPGG